jgi:hypothetical protein
MTGLLDIRQIVFPKEGVEFIYEHLRQAGTKGVEGVGLFYGEQQNNQFFISRSIIPAQRAYRTKEGLLYMVPGEELHRLNVWAYENSVKLIAQIHSHPTEAFHSETDDDYPMVTTIGGYSIVIPDFASGPIDLKHWEVYQLRPEKGWIHLSPIEVAERFIME